MPHGFRNADLKRLEMWNKAQALALMFDDMENEFRRRPRRRKTAERYAKLWNTAQIATERAYDAWRDCANPALDQKKIAVEVARSVQTLDKYLKQVGDFHRFLVTDPYVCESPEKTAKWGKGVDYYWSTLYSLEARDRDEPVR